MWYGRQSQVSKYMYCMKYEATRISYDHGDALVHHVTMLPRLQLGLHLLLSFRLNGPTKLCTFFRCKS
jgi:hypothetical protein